MIRIQIDEKNVALLNEVIDDYAAFHEVGLEYVEVDHIYNGLDLVGVRLSLDIDGRSRGCDERYEVAK